MERHGERVPAGSISARKAKAYRQLGFWEKHRQRIDDERDRGLTATYLLARRNADRAMRPWSVHRVLDHKFHARKAYEMAGYVALCLVLDQGFPCLVMSYADWAKLLGCCERTAGSTARELACGQWIEIRWHFVPFTGAHGRRCHAQMHCSFAPGPLLRVAYAIHQASLVRSEENLTGRAYREVVHSDGNKKLPAKGERSLYSPCSFLTSSYGLPAYPQPTRPKKNFTFNSKHYPRLLECARGMESPTDGDPERFAPLKTRAEAMRERPLTLAELEMALQESQEALRQAFALAAPLAPRPRPERPRRNLDAFQRFIRARVQRDAKAAAKREESRQLKFRPIAPVKPAGAEWTPDELRLALGCKPGCLCSLCWGQSPVVAAAPLVASNHPTSCACAVCFAARVRL
jgi:hypothetical protein